jgi:formylglycine-generating enzyme required for sulfatase activity
VGVQANIYCCAQHVPERAQWKGMSKMKRIELGIGALCGAALLTIGFAWTDARRAAADSVAPAAATSRKTTLPAPVVTVPCASTQATIPGGTFTLGSTNTESAWDAPPHLVTVARFCLDKTEVTVAAYDECKAAGACDNPLLSTSPAACNAVGAAKANHPRNCVTLAHAQQYCAWKGMRLPSEQEWEFAARGGSEQRTWPWGETAPAATSACWSRPMATGTCAAGGSPAGAYGLFDMAGNVQEWTSSELGNYPGGTGVSSTISPPPYGQVLRGGDYYASSPNYIKGARRFRSKATLTSPTYGFRCAK